MYNWLQCQDISIYCMVTCSQNWYQYQWTVSMSEHGIYIYFIIAIRIRNLSISPDTQY